MRWSIVVASIVLFGAPVAAMAHHSIAAVYDREKAISLTGRVTRVELVNPHSQIEIELMRADGAPVRWSFETSSPGGLERLGLDKQTLVIGDQVKAVGYPARSGGREAWLTRLETAKQTYNLSFRNRGPAPSPQPVN